MIELWVADLEVEEKEFNVPSAIGSWNFRQRSNYDELQEKRQEGQCFNSFYAYNEAITLAVSEEGFSQAIDELIDICLILSFLFGKCITPTGSTARSDIQFLKMGDKFLRSRAISGFPALKLKNPLNCIFSSGLPNICKKFSDRRMELFLSRWISGLTCFTLEDLFLSVGVQMDIIKQCEKLSSKKRLSYFTGMERASSRYGIAPLCRDYSKMRNDIVHEGKLSGSKFKEKTKSDCSSVIASTLNWIDAYVTKVLSIDNYIETHDRWNSKNLENGLPGISFHM